MAHLVVLTPDRILGVALVAQGIEHRPPEPGAQVRILPGAPAGLALEGQALTELLRNSHDDPAGLALAGQKPAVRCAH